MTKETYTVVEKKIGEGFWATTLEFKGTTSNGIDTTTRDAKYRSYLCVLLIVVALSLIMLLVGLKWTFDRAVSKQKGDFENLNLREQFGESSSTDEEDDEDCISEEETTLDDLPIRFRQNPDGGDDNETTSSTTDSFDEETTNNSKIGEYLTPTTQLLDTTEVSVSQKIISPKSQTTTDKEVLISSTIPSTTFTIGKVGDKDQEVTSSSSPTVSDGIMESPTVSSTPISSTLPEVVGVAGVGEDKATATTSITETST